MTFCLMVVIKLLLWYDNCFWWIWDSCHKTIVSEDCHYNYVPWLCHTSTESVTSQWRIPSVGTVRVWQHQSVLHCSTTQYPACSTAHDILDVLFWCILDVLYLIGVSLVVLMRNLATPSIRFTFCTRDLKYGSQIGSDWTQIGQIWDF